MLAFSNLKDENIELKNYKRYNSNSELLAIYLNEKVYDDFFLIGTINDTHFQLINFKFKQICGLLVYLSSNFYDYNNILLPIINTLKLEETSVILGLNNNKTINSDLETNIIKCGYIKLLNYPYLSFVKTVSRVAESEIYTNCFSYYDLVWTLIEINSKRKDDNMKKDKT